MFRKHRVRLQLLRHGLYSRPLKEVQYDATIGDRTLRLNHSRFNPKWLNQLQLTPQVIVELGAFDGGDALRFSQAFPETRVVAVEADPYRYRQVRQNLAGSRVEVEHFAVCESDGPVDWYSATASGEIDAQGSIYMHTESYKRQFPHVAQQAESVTVQGARVDTLCTRFGIGQIDLLHMDIEGAEYAALQSLGDMRPKVIFAETCDDRFVGVSGVADIHRLFVDMGYKLLADMGSDRLYFNPALCVSRSNRRAA